MRTSSNRMLNLWKMNLIIMREVLKHDTGRPTHTTTTAPFFPLWNKLTFKATSFQTYAKLTHPIENDENPPTHYYDVSGSAFATRCISIP